LDTDRRAVDLRVRVLVFATDPGWRSLLPGAPVTAAGRLAPARGGDLTAAVLRVTGPPTPRGGPPWTQRAAGSLRAGLQTASAPLPDEPGGLLPGLVVGDTSRLDPALAEDFRATGMTHLVAVSGANLAIVLAVVLVACRWIRLSPWAAAVVCALAVVGFVILARPSPSVVRAAAMGTIGLVALATGRPRAAAPALAAAVVVLVVADPALAADAGFALSVLATGGLVLLAPRWRDSMRARGVPAGLADALAVPAAAQVACAPVVAGLSGTVSAVAVPANLLAAPAVAPATLLGVAAAVVSPVWPWGATLLAWLGSWPARWLVLIAHTGADLPAGTVSWPGGVGGALLLGAVTVALLVATRHRVVVRLALVVVLAAMLGAAPVRLLASGWPPPGAVIVACDVGQGDAIVLPDGPGRAVLVDTGPDPAAVAACLRDLGVREIPLLVLTHLHADHIGGLAGALRAARVRAVAVPRAGQPPQADRALVDAVTAVGASVLRPAAGWVWAWPALTLTVLGPARSLLGTRSDANNNSVILRVVGPGVSMLLAGDAEVEEQRELVSATDPGLLRADVLKVAHHGSAYQDPAFLDLVDPRVALVSVGNDNGYGHPNAAVLAALVRGGAHVVRTDLAGDVAVVVRHGALGVAHHRRVGGPPRRAAATSVAAEQTMIGHSWTVLSGPNLMQGWVGDPRRGWSAAPHPRRRGTSRSPRGGGGRCRRPGRRSGRVRHRTRRGRHVGRRPGHRGEPVAVRRSPGGGRPSGAGRQEGARRGAAGLPARAGPGGEPGVRARGRCQGQGAGRRGARRRRAHGRCVPDHPAPRPGRLRPRGDPPTWRQVSRGRGRGAARRRGQRPARVGRRVLATGG
jgi:competence protein ComEC